MSHIGTERQNSQKIDQKQWNYKTTLFNLQNSQSFGSDDNFLSKTKFRIKNEGFGKNTVCTKKLLRVKKVRSLRTKKMGSDENLLGHGKILKTSARHLCSNSNCTSPGSIPAELVANSPSQTVVG